MRFVVIALLCCFGCSGEDPPKKPKRAAKEKKLNRLAKEKSLYLRQHQANPVDWYPWGEEAFEKAKKEDKPVFLSIGYSSCHWCHVMEHESFEDEEVAAILNKYFVCIKVDREERPDVDAVYMNAVVYGMRIGGGWPLSVWLTPARQPFHGGTYYPKKAKPELGIRMGFIELLNLIKDAWKDKEKRKQIEKASTGLAGMVQEIYDMEEPEALKAEALKDARAAAQMGYDRVHGGYGQPPRYAPKFPNPSAHEMMLRYAMRYGDKDALGMVTQSLDKMARGGIHDHAGGGFHRYSTTRDWLVPHFEKMLYDNAQLLGLYAWAHLATGDELYAETARDIATWVLREMTGENGAFYSAQDADDPGGPEGEGGFYVWDPVTVKEVLGEEAAKPVLQRFGIRDLGNWPEKPGKSLLQVLDKNVAFDPESRRKMYEAREKRPKPVTDKKVLTGWNGLMISGFCRAYQALGERAYLDAAKKTGGFIKSTMTKENGRLLRRWEDGEAAHAGVLPDYAYMIAAYLDLYETTFDAAWLKEAMRLNALTLELFSDEKQGGFFFTPKDGEKLIARGRNGFDQARPSGNGIMAMNLLRLAELTGNQDMRAHAQKTLDYFGARVSGSALGFASLLNALDFSQAGTREIFIAGAPDDPATHALIEAVWKDPSPNRVIALVTPGIEKLLPPAVGRTTVDGRPAAYVCKNFTCKAPVTTPEELKALNK